MTTQLTSAIPAPSPGRTKSPTATPAKVPNASPPTSNQRAHPTT